VVDLSNASRQAWLLISTDERAFGGNTGYDDQVNSSYKWDSTVKYSSHLRVGDIIVIFDKHNLIGSSIIDSISVEKSNKLRMRCPECGTPKFQSRKTKLPLFRCGNPKCLHEFDDPISEIIEVTGYSSNHEAGWIDLEGLATGDELRKISISPKSPDSIKPFNFEKFLQLISKRVPSYDLKFVENLPNEQSHGHSLRNVRVRVGQGKFRQGLLETYGDSCALTGPTPKAAIEACHLYSYAQVGKHDEHGGLLMRRDLHALFDKGLLTINATNRKIIVSHELMKFPTYAALHETDVKVELSDRQLAWIRAHSLNFEEFS
jgi:hypothetical protein